MSPAVGSLTPRSISDALRSSAMELGCPVGFLQGARISTLVRGGDDGEVRTFARDGVGVVSIPSGLVAGESRLDEWGHELLDLTLRESAPGTVVEFEGGELQVTSDPPALWVADEHTLRGAATAPRFMMVRDPNAALIDELRLELDAKAWHALGTERPHRHVVGALLGGMLVGVASVEEPVAHLSRVRVAVAPSVRRRGIARELLHGAARSVVQAGALPCCRIAEGDVAARQLATAAGFVPFARVLVLRHLERAPDAQLLEPAPASPV